MGDIYALFRNGGRSESKHRQASQLFGLRLLTIVGRSGAKMQTSANGSLRCEGQADLD